MAKSFFFTSKPIFCLFFISTIFSYANSARLLDEVEAQPQVINDTPNPTTTPVIPPTFPTGQIPAVSPTATEEDDDEDADPPTLVAPVVNDVAPSAAAVVPVAATPNPIGVAPESNPAASTLLPSGSAVVNPSAGSHEPALSFFMHDILGGSHPSARVVTGIVASTEVNGIPFSKTNNNIFPVNGGTPLVNLNDISKIINSNNAPLLTGLNGAQSSNLQSGNNQPFVTAGQLPPGSTLQRLMFGTITVIDDELTEGHELGSAVMGRAQGFYLSSSLDGTSQTIALTILLHSGDHHDVVEDAISFFGVHRTASHASHIAVIGGTGLYENAKGYATIETLHQEDQHTTDGVDTIMHFNVYLT